MLASDRQGLSLAVALVALASTLLGAGCTTEVHPVGPQRIALRERGGALQKIEVINHDGRHLGWAASYAVPGTDQRFVLVHDGTGTLIGELTTDGRALAYRAHGDPVVVAIGVPPRRGIAAVFGIPEGVVQLAPLGEDGGRPAGTAEAPSR